MAFGGSFYEFRHWLCFAEPLSWRFTSSLFVVVVIWQSFFPVTQEAGEATEVFPIMIFSPMIVAVSVAASLQPIWRSRCPSGGPE